MKPNVNDMTFEEFSNFFNPIRAVIKGAHANLHDKDYEGVTDIFLGGGKCSDFEGVVKRAFEIKEELKAISKTRKASVDNLKKTLGDILFTIHQKWAELDDRFDNVVAYPCDAVILTAMLSNIGKQGNTCDYICRYWMKFNPLLQVLIPNMPTPDNLLSRETVRRVLKLVGKDNLINFFNEHFGMQEAKTEVSHNKDIFPQKPNMADTSCADGQELKGSYKKGEYRRNKKAGIVVSTYNAEDDLVQAIDITDKKGNEHVSIAKMLHNIKVKEKKVFMADAINSKDSVLKVLRDNPLYELILVVKGVDAIKEAFSNNILGAKTFSYSEDQSGRHVERELTFIKSPKLPCKEGVFDNVKTLIRVYTKSQEFRTNSPNEPPEPSEYTRYFISTIEMDEAGIEQMLHSISVYWRIEVHHNTLDTVIYQDKINANDEDCLASRVMLNNITYNVLSFARQKMKSSKNTLPTFANVMENFVSPEKALVLLCMYWKQCHPLDTMERPKVPKFIGLQD